MNQLNKFGLVLIFISILSINLNFNKFLFPSIIPNLDYNDSIPNMNKNKDSLKYKIHERLVSNEVIDSIIKRSIIETIRKMKSRDLIH